ncbi:MAG: hypothetical protein HOI23_12245 [Deltaproteobacteria bacterium]|nr:hypothetical protein [Deltaproteobacteria bacterium]
MTTSHLFRASSLTYCILLMAACTGAEPTTSAPTGNSTDVNDNTDNVDSGQAEETVKAFTHKMMKSTGENPFAALAYECQECTFEQWESIVPPDGWTKGPAQIAVFSAEDSGMRSTPSVEGHPDTVDFLDDMPGNEYKIIARPLDGEFVESGANGIVAKVQVKRDTLLVFTPGMRVHELTSPEGDIFVLFAHHVDPENIQAIDFQEADALDYFTAPTGWTYSTRILDEELALDADNYDGVVTVLAIRGDVNSTWEKR